MFRQKQMQDPEILKVLNEEYKEQLEQWYKDVTSDDTKSNVVGFALEPGSPRAQHARARARMWYVRAWRWNGVARLLTVRPALPQISDKLTFEDWLRVINSMDIAGVWEVEQLSEITGDASCKANIKCSLSIPKCKNAFLDSQKIQDMGVAQSDATEAVLCPGSSPESNTHLEPGVASTFPSSLIMIRQTHPFVCIELPPPTHTDQCH